MLVNNSKAIEYLTFGGGRPCEELMGTLWWKHIHTQRIHNKLASRQIFDDTVKEIGEDIKAKKLSQVRFLSKDFEQFQETVISGNLVSITVFTNNPYSFLIEDEQVAQGYKKHFELLWKKAK